jgi:ribose transport system substrate-binding protein
MRTDKYAARFFLAGAALAFAAGSPASAKDIKSVGISVGSLGNPGFVIIANTATRIFKKAYPQAQVTTVGYDYDLGKQVNEIDNFIAAGVHKPAKPAT